MPSQEESISWNRFLSFLNVYKLGLWSSFHAYNAHFKPIELGKQ